MNGHSGNCSLTAKILAVFLASTCACALPAHARSPEDFTPDQWIEYKTVGDTSLKLHVFYPEGHKPSDKRAAVVFFHGGAWKGGNPYAFYPHSEYLASRGVVALSAEYRVAWRNKTSPRECVIDGKSAIRWIRANARSLGVDPDRIAAGGGSAGGQVAAAAGTATSIEGEGDNLDVSCRPNALILFNPVLDNGPGGYGHRRVERYWEAFSPLHNIDQETPPTIVFLGTKDKLVPVATAETYKQRMEENGRRCDLHLFEGQPHGFFQYVREENYNRTVILMDRFLESLGYFQGAPVLPPAPSVGESP